MGHLILELRLRFRALLVDNVVGTVGQRIACGYRDLVTDADLKRTLKLTLKLFVVLEATEMDMTRNLDC